MPLRSAKVVESAASAGGLWFQPGRKMVSSVREGQFMMRIVPKILNEGRQNESWRGRRSLSCALREKG
jgi:hypothetical protein